MKIHIVNGPNLNLLGSREPEIYGNSNFDDFFVLLKKRFPTLDLSFFQSNIEGELINYLQKHGFDADGIVLNAAGYTHTSVSIADAVSAIASPVIEVHISNIYAREAFRHVSLIAPNTIGCISGFGLESYALAIQYFLNKTS